MKRLSDRAESPYPAVMAAPGFCLGVRCDEREIHAIEFLEPRPESTLGNPLTNVLATEAVRQLRAYLADPDFAFSLPLRPSGTTFQRRVWAQIAAIPSHQTQTYGDLAKVLHNAPRAVGQACGANPFPLIIPCHRVIAAGGGLGGFARNRGGFLLEVKRWLLAHERR